MLPAPPTHSCSLTASQQPPRSARLLPEAGVLQVVVQALVHNEALSKGFDLTSKPEGEGAATTDFAALFQQTQAGL